MLTQIVEDGPIPEIHGVVRRRLMDLASWIWEEFNVSLDVPTVGRGLKRLQFSKISARPQNKGQNEFDIEDFKKAFPARWKRSAASSRLAHQ